MRGCTAAFVWLLAWMLPYHLVSYTEPPSNLGKTDTSTVRAAGSNTTIRLCDTPYALCVVAIPCSYHWMRNIVATKMSEAISSPRSTILRLLRTAMCNVVDLDFMLGACTAHPLNALKQQQRIFNHGYWEPFDMKNIKTHIIQFNHHE